MAHNISETDPLLLQCETREASLESFAGATHEYRQRRMGCPCPAISAMINHSYLYPRDDDDLLPFLTLVKALRHCYNLSFPFAFCFVLLANLRLGTLRSGGFSLKHLKKHGLIEHDASISRFDANEGDYLNPQSELIAEFLDGINYPPGLSDCEKMVTLEDYARKRTELENKITSYLPQQPKYRIHLLGIGEAALALHAFADKDSPVYLKGICARSQWLKIWYNEERFPLELGWKNKRPGYKITLFSFFRTARKLFRTMKLHEITSS